MDDNSHLLEQLRIDRDAEVSRGRGSWRWAFASCGALLLAGATAGAWAFFSRPESAEGALAPTEQEIAGNSPAAATNSAPNDLNASTGRRAEPPSSTSMLDASGYVVARRSATVASKSIGRVVEVAIEEGQRVEQGQVIARLDDSNTRAALIQTRAQVEQARANLDAARTALEDARRIFERHTRQSQAGLISSQDFDNATATFNAAESEYQIRERGLEVAMAGCAIAERNQEDMTVRAPFAGVITVKAAQPGEIVSPQSGGGGFTRTGIGTIVDMDSLEVEVDVSENFINRVRAGQAATVKLNAYPDWNIPAQVIAVIPTADRAKATVKVRIGFKERDARVLPDMGARVSFLQSSTT